LIRTHPTIELRDDSLGVMGDFMDRQRRGADYGAQRRSEEEGIWVAWLRGTVV